MERILWKAKVLPGKEEEYVSRHNNIWPEMLENLKAQGISNYSIFKSGRDIIGYYECESVEKMKRVKTSNPVAAQWAESMKGIMEIETEPDGTAKVFTQVFYMD